MGTGPPSRAKVQSSEGRTWIWWGWRYRPPLPHLTNKGIVCVCCVYKCRQTSSSKSMRTSHDHRPPSPRHPPPPTPPLLHLALDLGECHRHPSLLSGKRVCTNPLLCILINVPLSLRSMPFISFPSSLVTTHILHLSLS